MARRTFDIDITGNPNSALNAFMLTQRGALATQTRVGGAMTKMGAITKTAMLGIGVAVVGGGAAMVGLGAKFDKAENTIRVGTGKTGKALEGLKNDFKGVLKEVPADFGDASTAISDLNTRLGLTGEPLQGLSAQFLELSRITGDDLGGNIASVTRLFGDWSVKAADMPDKLDGLFRASQESGISIDRLSTLMVDFGSPLRQMGVDMDFAAAMFANFEKAGVATEKLMPGMRQGLKNLSGASPKVTEELKAMGISTTDVGQGLKDTFKLIKEAKDPMEATQLAFKVFGERAGPDMAAAVREGRFELDDLMDVITDGGDTIRDAGKDTMTLGDRWTLLKNRVFVNLEPLAKKAFDAVGRGMDALGPAMDNAMEAGRRWWTKFGPGITEALASIRDWVVKNWPGFRDTIVAILRAVAGWIERNWPGIRDTIVTVFEAVAGWIDRNWPGIRDTIVTVFEAVTGWVSRNWPPFRDAVMSAFEAIVSWVDEHWPAIQETITDVLTTISTVTRGILRVVQDLWDRFGSAILSTLEVVWDAVVLIVETALKVLRGIIEVITGIVTMDWDKFWTGIKRLASAAWDFIVEAIQLGGRFLMAALEGIWAGIQLAAHIAWEILKTGVRLAWEWVRERIESIVGVISRFLSRTWDSFVGFVEAPLELIKTVVSTAFGAVRDTVSDIMGGIRDFLRRTWNTIVGIVRTPVNSIIKFVNTLIGGINKVLDLIPGLSGNIPTIPEIPSSSGATSTPTGREARSFGMATGGVIPIGAGFMTRGPQAIVGEGRPQFPEFVIPTDPQYRTRAAGLLSAATEQIMPRMALGGVVGSVFDAGKSAMGAVGGFFGGLFRKALVRLFDPIAQRVIDGLGNLPDLFRLPEAAQGVARSIWDWVKGADSALPEEPPPPPPGAAGLGPSGGVQRWAGVATQALRLNNQSLSWLGDLLTQMNMESGGNPQAINRWDSNWIAGHPSVGLMQMIRGSYQAYKLPGLDRGPHAYGVSMDPLSNTAAAVAYTQGKFGTLARWRRGGFRGYGEGGVVGSAGGYTHPGEMVLTRADQFRMLKMIRGGDSGTVLVRVEPGAIVIGVPQGADDVEAERRGRAASKGFLAVLSERRVKADAKLR